MITWRVQSKPRPAGRGASPEEGTGWRDGRDRWTGHKREPHGGGRGPGPNMVTDWVQRRGERPEVGAFRLPN